jgi:hypothetical protein
LFPLTLLGAMLKLPGGRGRRVTPLRSSAQSSLGAVTKFPGTASRLSKQNRAARKALGLRWKREGRAPESPHHASGCETSRSQLCC